MRRWIGAALLLLGSSVVCAETTRTVVVVDDLTGRDATYTTYTLSEKYEKDPDPCLQSRLDCIRNAYLLGLHAVGLSNSKFNEFQIEGRDWREISLDEKRELAAAASAVFAAKLKNNPHDKRIPVLLVDRKSGSIFATVDDRGEVTIRSGN